MNVRWIQSIVTFLILLTRCSYAVEETTNIGQISLEAQALWEANDYEGARERYEKLPKDSLSDWQMMRLRYNEGSLHLAQHQFKEATLAFQSIDPFKLSLPRFTRDLFLNEGIAHLQMGESLDIRSPFYHQQMLYFDQAIELLNQAHALNCQMESIEDEKGPCTHHAMIEGWIKNALTKREASRQQMIQTWLKEASIESLATYLSLLLQELISKIKSFQNVKQAPVHWTDYLRQQTETLATVWNALKEKKLSPPQLVAFDKAGTAYLHAIDALSQSDKDSSLSLLAQAFDQLRSLSYQQDIDLQLAHLNFQILFLLPTWREDDIQSLQWAIDQLKEKNQSEGAEKIKNLLMRALQALQAKQPQLTRFFLLAAFARLDSKIPEKDPSSLAKLKWALTQANLSFELLLLAGWIPNPTFENEKLDAMIQEAQNDVITRADLFIPAVLKDQENLFQQPNHSFSRCQESPWNQVIPLFDNGYVAAMEGAKLFALSSTDRQKIAAEQERTLDNWQRAVNLMMSPPKTSPKPSPAAPKNLAETLRQIQEMYLEDQARPKPIMRERHTW